MEQIPRILSQRDDFMSNDCISQVASMINNSGANRSQRRRIEKSLNKVENIRAHVQKKVDRSAYEEYKKDVDKNFIHFFCILALTMGEDYKWREDETHDQISSLLERVNKKIIKYANMGYSTEDLIEHVDKEYDIRLIPDEH